VQGLSSKATQRMSAIENRQDHLNEKLFEVLACTKAHTEALEELKSMFAKYIGRFRESDEGSPSVSKSALENQVSQPSPLIQLVEVQNVNTSDQEECQVDSGGQKIGATVKGNNVNDNKANRVEKG
jgi:hypothetical protein